MLQLLSFSKGRACESDVTGLSRRHCGLETLDPQKLDLFLLVRFKKCPCRKETSRRKRTLQDIVNFNFNFNFAQLLGASIHMTCVSIPQMKKALTSPLKSIPESGSFTLRDTVFNFNSLFGEGKTRLFPNLRLQRSTVYGTVVHRHRVEYMAVFKQSFSSLVPRRKYSSPTA